MNTYVIYHAGCMDGFGAAWAAWRHLPNHRSVRYLPAAYGDSPPVMEAGSRVYILDFSYPRETMLELIRQHDVTLLDHHETALADIGDLPGCHFDLDHSGAVIAWRHFAGGDAEMPEVLEYIEDRDLWRWKLPNSREVSAALDAFPKNFDRWDGLIPLDLMSGEPINTLALQGDAILQANGRHVERTLSTLRMRNIAGHLVPAVNTPVLASEACERVLELHPEAPFAAAWYETREGRTRWSLRSRVPDGMDVSLIARRLGGGGHPHAAGFTGRPPGGADPGAEGPESDGGGLR